MNIRNLCINKTGKYIDVYGYPQGNGVMEKIGTLYPNEAFIDYGSEGDPWHMIYFKDPNGNVVDGEVKTASGLFTLCTAYPYGTVTINGTKYKTFKMKKQKPIYSGSGRRLGTVAAGMLVATNSATTGLNNVDWKLIHYAKSTSGQWQKIDGDGYDHGFVPIDLDEGSMPSNINFYGSW